MFSKRLLASTSSNIVYILNYMRYDCGSSKVVCKVLQSCSDLIISIGRVGRAERMGLAISLSSTVKEKVIICVLAFKALVLLLFHLILLTGNLEIHRYFL